MYDHSELADRFVESLAGLTMGVGAHMVLPEKPLEEAGEIKGCCSDACLELGSPAGSSCGGYADTS